MNKMHIIVVFFACRAPAAPRQRPAGGGRDAPRRQTSGAAGTQTPSSSEKIMTAGFSEFSASGGPHRGLPLPNALNMGSAHISCVW